MMMTTPTPGQPLSEADVSLLQPGDWLRDSARRLCRFDHLMRPDYIWARIGQGASCGGGVGTFTFVGRPDQDGWIAWSGGENPVPGVRVDVRFRDGEIRLNDQHSDKRWRHDPTIFLRFHIAAYRPHAPVSRPAGEGEREAVARVDDLVEMLSDWFERIPGFQDTGEGTIKGVYPTGFQDVEFDHLSLAKAILALLSPAAPDAGGGEPMKKEAR